MAKVLIVDDSPTETYKLTGMLEKNGHTVITAENGEAGDGLYSNRLGNLQLYMGALAEHHGLVKGPVVNRSIAPPAPSSVDVNALTAPTQGSDTNAMMQ